MEMHCHQVDHTILPYSTVSKRWLVILFSGHPQIEKEIRHADILGIVKVFTSFHPQSAGKEALTTACGAGYEYIKVFRDIITCGESKYKILVKLSSRMMAIL